MGWTYIPGVSEEELYHHGILDQKWGRRRYQNLDGSYTQAGRARYGIFDSRKRKMSKDAKLRAKERVRVKNEEVRREAYAAEAERARAQTDAERAKTELREAKKQNSLAYKLGSKAAENAAYKAEQKRMTKEANKPLSKNASKYIEAIQSGNKRQIERVARKLNNDEYRAAINRINMTYEMDRLKTEANIAKGKQTVQRLTNAANMLSSGADVWNAGAGIISAFSGKNVPKINTKYVDPLDTIKKQLEVKSKEEALRTATATADKTEELARQERIKTDAAKKEWDESEAERRSEAQVKKAQYTLDRLKGNAKNTVLMPTQSETQNVTFDSMVRRKETKPSASDQKEMYDFEHRPRNVGLRDDSGLRISGGSIKLSDVDKAHVRQLNKFTGANRKGKKMFKEEGFTVPMGTLNVSRGKKVVDDLILNVPNKSFYNLSKYADIETNPEDYNRSTRASNHLMVKGNSKTSYSNLTRALRDSNIDVSALPKDQQELFFKFLNAR